MKVYIIFYHVKWCILTTMMDFIKEYESNHVICNDDKLLSE